MLYANSLNPHYYCCMAENRKIILIIRRLLFLYIVIVAVIVHIAGAGLIFFFPDVRNALENRLASNFDSEKPQQTNLNKEIAKAFGVWTAYAANGFDNQKILIGKDVYPSLTAATLALKAGDTLELGPGVYTTPLIIRQNNITLIGRGRVVLDGVAAEGKAAIVVSGNGLRVVNIECKGISVPDENGACIRHEGADLTLEHVYFHDSEQGVLTGSQPGRVVIQDSRFEKLGRNGLAHGVYAGGGELYIADSLFIATVSEGHEIKSRAKVTEILRTVVASLSAVDSRLIDISNGGGLRVRNSVLEKGSVSSNPDVIGYGLEGMKYADNFIELKNNCIIMERNASSTLLHSAMDLSTAVISGNIVVSKKNIALSEENKWYKTRREANFGEFPEIPKINKNSEEFSGNPGCLGSLNQVKS